MYSVILPSKSWNPNSGSGQQAPVLLADQEGSQEGSQEESQEEAIFIDGKTLKGSLKQGSSIANTLDVGHGRIKERCLTCSDALLGYSDWPGLHQVFKVERRFTYKRTGKVHQETVALQV